MKSSRDKKFKFTVIALAIALCATITSTIILAAFSANKTGDVVLSFADGLTLSLSPKNGTGTIKITGAGSDVAK